MKRANFKNIFLASAMMPVLTASAQDLHFSQFFNAPLLLNPANTGLMPDHDYRLGANFRNQWASIPVPYRTLSAYADFQAMKAGDMESSNWLGLGLAFFNDKAGNGELGLNKFEGFVAYHIHTGDHSMISAGLSAGYVQRSIDFNKLTYDVQWDGFSFNGTLPNHEKASVVKTSFFDVGAGVNYAYVSDVTYLRVGLGVAHVNMPKESFYGMSNRVGIRPSANIDAVFKMGGTFIANPSVYYSYQSAASELVAGTLLQFLINGEGSKANQFLVGAYYRLNESVVPAIGFEKGTLRFLASYDITMSNLTTANKGNGAMEFGLRYMGDYGRGGHAGGNYGCPRF